MHFSRIYKYIRAPPGYFLLKIILENQSGGSYEQVKSELSSSTC